MRQDDHGNEFVVRDDMSEDEARALTASLKARGHKQSYWIEPLEPVEKRCASVLSVQSFVSYGHVGNSAAAFALRRMGIDVWPVHTVALSSHLGHSGWGGRAIEPTHIEEILGGLEALGALGRADAVIFGFLGDVERARAALSLLPKLSSQARVILDPVLGDHGVLYLPEELVAFYRDHALAHAHTLTPNIFELGLLSGLEISSIEDVHAAVRVLFDEHPSLQQIVAKGFEVSESELELTAATRDMTRSLRVARRARRFVGAGDLFAATLTAELVLQRGFFDAVALAASITGEILAVTEELGSDELALVAAQGCFDGVDLSAAVRWIEA